ncbi:MAG: HesA/MoeB/ThiF family protein [Tissierellia bacterium]|nr:HesA/MoeB/ThiF family protein [Tissierellia bacterium]
MERYARNFKSLTQEEQAILFKSNIAIIGLGGLGGYVLENLVRLGVKKFHLIDRDVFEESNLNRQILSLEQNMGKYKTDEAYRRAKAIDHEVDIKTFTDTLDRSSREMLEGVDLVIDCLDSVESRIELEALCDSLNLILVHGAIGGYCGQIALSTPGNRLFHKIYTGSNIANPLGNLPMTCMVTASIQVSLALRVLFNKPVEDELIYVDVEDMNLVKVGL